MTEDRICHFCGGPLTEEEMCQWCGFTAQAKNQLDGTLPYGTHLDIYRIGDVIDVDGESTSYMAYDTVSQRKVIINEFLRKIGLVKTGYMKLDN